ncbi:MAG: protein kinase [Caldimonas sp.]
MSQQQDDEEGTVIRPQAAASIAPPAAAPPARKADGSSGSGHDALSLHLGTRLAEFEITGRIGDGGFSIVYLAMDHSLERTVALKEYMPMSLATRVGTTQVEPRSERYRDTFDAGLKSFVNEAKLLAQFDHPSLVKVYRFWEANGTAYMVMPFYQGITVKDAVRAMSGPPDEAWLMALLAPLTQALAVIHGEYCYHRDIAPDNVILLAGSNKPLLLDFGAARRVIGDMTQALTVILKSGYAPVEQYAEIPGMKQGPWTDIYALAAVVYWCITGQTPPTSVGRLMSDSFVPLAECAAARYSAPFLEAIDRALAVRPEKRTQSIAMLREELGLADDGTGASRPAWDDFDSTVIRPAGQRTARIDPTSRLATEFPVSAQVTEPPGVVDVPSPTRNTVTRAGLEFPATAVPQGTHALEVPSEPPPTDEDALRPEPADVVGTGKTGIRRIALVVSATAAVAAGAIWWALHKPAVETASPPRAQDSGSITPSSTLTQGTGDASSATGTTRAAADAPVSSPSISPPTSESPSAATVPVDPSTAANPPASVDTPAAKPDVASASAPSAPVAPVADAPKRTTKKSIQPDNAAAARPDPSSERASKRPDAAAPERAQADSTTRAECGRIFQRLSLGETSPELLERLKTLKCR